LAGGAGVMMDVATGAEAPETGLAGGVTVMTDVGAGAGAV